MKTKVIYLLLLSVVVSSAVSASSVYELYKGRETVKVIFKGEELKSSDVPAFIESDRTMVPLNLLNQMGFNTNWDSKTHTVDVNENESWIEESFAKYENEIPEDFQIVAHRGESTEAPENTIPAFQYAIDHNVKYLETDVQMTKDGVPVMIHDETVDRTTDGTGEVKNMTAEEISKLDAGSWKDGKFKGTKVPTLKEFVALIKANPEIKVYFEIKGYRNQSDIDTYINDIQSVKQQMIVHTGNIVDSEYISKKSPDLLRSYDPVTSEEINQYINESLPNGGITMSVSKLLVTYSFIQWLHSLNIKINVWPIDDEKEMFMYRLMGADGVTTFKPSNFQALIDGGR